MNAAMDIALSGMRAAQISITVASHNVANANVEGYTRQRAVTVAAPPVGQGAMLGGGVDVKTVQRLSDRWTGRHIREELSQQGYYQTMSERLGEIESVFNETNGGGISEALNEFYSGLSQLADQPESQGVRQTTINAARTIAVRVRNGSQQLSIIERDARLAIDYEVTNVNTMLDKVAELNATIVGGLAAKQNVGDLQDERDRVMRDLATALGAAAYVSQDEGQASLSIGGVSLVLGPEAVHIAHTATGYVVADTGAAVDVQQGTLGALHDMVDPSDGVVKRYQDQLDALAGGLITAMNTQHAAGYGLDGVDGRPLFTGTDSQTIAVNQDLLDDPGLLAAAATAAPGDGNNARAMYALRQQPMVAGQTIDDYFQEMVGGIGAEARTATSQSDGLQMVVDDLIQRSEALRGVSLDAEMADLIRFQQAFNAATRFVQAVDEMTQALLSAV